MRTKPTKKPKTRKKEITAQEQKRDGKLIVHQICRTIKEHFPDLSDQVGEHVNDPRGRRTYKVAEIVMAAVAMFLFREGSRHSFNSDRRQETFIKNYERLFRVRMPHMDTVDATLRLLPPEGLEKLKATLVGGLIEKKVLHRFKFLGKSFIVAIDGTGLHSYDQRHCEHCLHRTSSNGVTTYFHNVLEAKLVTPNGLAISLCTEWIANGDQGTYDKQDCEHSAFKRLAVKLKGAFPRLPICITADGLYPNQHFFAICAQNGWDFIVTLKDGNLPSLQEELQLLLPLAVNSSTERTITNKCARTTQAYRWVNNLEHKGTTIHWIECQEETVATANGRGREVKATRFVHVTNMEVTRDTACDISDGGRLRWKIENEGFNTQKNRGYNIEHKYSRVSFTAMQNYYQCLQIAHLINQLVEKSMAISALLQDKFSITHLWEKILLGFLIWVELDEPELAAIRAHRCQIRLAG